MPNLRNTKGSAQPSTGAGSIVQDRLRRYVQSNEAPFHLYEPEAQHIPRKFYRLACISLVTTSKSLVSYIS